MQSLPSIPSSLTEQIEVCSAKDFGLLILNKRQNSSCSPFCATLLEANVFSQHLQSHYSTVSSLLQLQTQWNRLTPTQQSQHQLLSAVTCGCYSKRKHSNPCDPPDISTMAKPLPQRSDSLMGHTYTAGYSMAKNQDLVQSCTVQMAF